MFLNKSLFHNHWISIKWQDTTQLRIPMTMKDELYFRPYLSLTDYIVYKNEKKRVQSIEEMKNPQKYTSPTK